MNFTMLLVVFPAFCIRFLRISVLLMMMKSSANRHEILCVELMNLLLYGCVPSITFQSINVERFRNNTSIFGVCVCSTHETCFYKSIFFAVPNFQNTLFICYKFFCNSILDFVCITCKFHSYLPLCYPFSLRYASSCYSTMGTRIATTCMDVNSTSSSQMLATSIHAATRCGSLHWAASCPYWASVR